MGPAMPLDWAIEGGWKDFVHNTPKSAAVIGNYTEDLAIGVKLHEFTCCRPFLVFVIKQDTGQASHDIQKHEG